MPQPLRITSPANPRVKSLVALRRRRVREAEGRTLIEGYDEVALALEADLAIESLVLCPELMSPAAVRSDLAGQARWTGAPEVLEVSRAAFEKIAYREGPDGVLAVVPSLAVTVRELDLPVDALVLVCEGVEKPGNLGAMLRTADAAGVDAVIAADPLTDWGNPNTVRASKGTLFSVPVASGPSEEVLAWLAEQGIPLVAATPDTDSGHPNHEYTEIDYTGPTAIAVGAESTGLTDATLAAAMHRVRIPMAGRVNSLNVATSAAIIVYEAVRQRGSRPVISR